MIDLVPPPAPEAEFAIAYESFGGSTHNVEFKGKGRLIVRTNPLSYIFRGKRRKLFAGPEVDLVLSPDEICNVTVSGRQIRFKAPLGTTTKVSQLFVFHAATASEAAALASLLPIRQDEEFTAARDFYARLNAVAGVHSPWTSVTNIIVALNIAVFVVMGCLGAGWFETANMEPYIAFAANNGAATTDGEWWRLLTSMFVHYGAIHLLANMWALFQVGHFLEKLLGRRLYALTYLASGLAGGFASIFWHGDKIWSAGASGAIFGVYGAVFGYLLREKQSLPASVYQPMLKSTLIFAGYNILYGFKVGVDGSAHVGGALAGVAFGWLLALPVDREIRARKTGRTLGVGLVALAVLVAAGVIFTPRYDYNVADELKWEEAVKDIGTTESELLQHHQKAMTAIDQGGDGTEHAAWITKELIPYYDGLDRTISALQLKPDRITSRRRDSLDRIFREKVQACQKLVVALRARDAAGVRQYYNDEIRISGEIAKLNKP